MPVLSIHPPSIFTRSLAGLARAALCGALAVLILPPGPTPAAGAAGEAQKEAAPGFADPSAVNLVFWPGATLTSSTPQNVEQLLNRSSTIPWVSNRFEPTQWIQLDIGQEQKAIYRVRIVVNRYPAHDFDRIRPVGIRVLVGNDEEMNGGELVKEIEGNQEWVMDLRFEPTQGRYVRVEFSGSERVGNCEISGLEVYSRDAKALHPGYPISETRSGGAKVVRISGWWSLNSSRDGLNLLSEKRVGNIEHRDDQAVLLSANDEDATVRVDLPAPYDLKRIRVGHTRSLGAYVSPEKVRLAVSADDRAYYSLGEIVLDTANEFTDVVAPGAAGWPNVRYLRLTIPRDTEKPAKNLTRLELFGAPASGAGVDLALTPPVPTGKAVCEVDVPQGARLSAAIYEPGGRLLRTLHALEPVAPGRRTLHWDGRDDFGQAVAAGELRYRIAYSRITPEPLPAVGNSARPMTIRNSASTFVSAFATDQAGNWYQTASFDEAGKAVRQYLADGTPGWSFNHNGSFGIAIDDESVYVLACDIGGSERGQRVLRLAVADGRRMPYEGLPGGMIVVNEKEPLPVKTGGARDFTDEQNRQIIGAHGIVVAGDSLWVSNYRKNRIERFDKETGDARGGFSVPMPMGIAAAADGTLWVAHGGDRATRFDTNGKALATLEGLSDPLGIAVGGGDGGIYITERNTGRILNYSPKDLRQRWARGRLARPGPLVDDAFRWANSAAIGVDPAGRYLVADNLNHRIQRFNADGSLLATIKADFGQPGPAVAPEIDPTLLLSGYFQYKVDLETGQWRQTHNWRPQDDRFAKGSSFIRRLANGRDYLFFINPSHWGVVAYLIAEDGGGLRRSAMFGRHWPGVDDRLDHQWKIAPFGWRDLNGNGEVEQEETEEKEDLSYFANHGWVDERGTFWFLDTQSGEIRTIAVSGFDELENPIFDFNQRELAVAADQIPAGSWNLVRPGPGAEEVYLIGETEESRAFRKGHGLYHSGGFAVARFRQGMFAGLFHMPIQMISLVSDGRFVYVGQNPDPQRVCVYTPEGLLVAELIPGEEAGWSRGWMDTVTPLAALHLKEGDIHHVYTEEVAYSQLLHYRFESGGNRLEEREGSFTWKPEE